MLLKSPRNLEEEGKRLEASRLDHSNSPVLHRTVHSAKLTTFTAGPDSK